MVGVPLPPHGGAGSTVLVGFPTDAVIGPTVIVEAPTWTCSVTLAFPEAVLEYPLGRVLTLNVPAPGVMHLTSMFSVAVQGDP